MVGLLFGEGKILMNKYQEKFGITKWEANKKVGEFVEKLKLLHKTLENKDKSELEIKNKLQQEFEREFNKLCE